MKRKIYLFILIVGMLPALHIRAGIEGEGRVGLYNSKNSSVEPVENTSAGLYNNRQELTGADSDEGSLRAGGNMGGGTANKVPAKDSLLLVLVVAAGYLVWKKKKNQGVF
jgi:hypothetical protein